MRTIYLIRHGESIQNVGVNERLRIPDHAIYLTDKGHEQAEEMSLWLQHRLRNMNPSNRVLWVSPYKRTRETASHITDKIAFSSTKEDDMLTELQFGIFDSIPKEKIKDVFPIEWESFQNNRRFNGKFYARRPGGESPFDCEIRQKLFIDTLFRDFKKHEEIDTVVIVGHGAAINIFRKAMFHYNHEWYETEPNPGNCSIIKVELNDDADNKDCGYVYGKPMEEKK